MARHGFVADPHPCQSSTLSLVLCLIIFHIQRAMLPSALIIRMPMFFILCVCVCVCVPIQVAPGEHFNDSAGNGKRPTGRVVSAAYWRGGACAGWRDRLEVAVASETCVGSLLFAMRIASAVLLMR